MLKGWSSGEDAWTSLVKSVAVCGCTLDLAITIIPRVDEKINEVVEKVLRGVRNSSDGIAMAQRCLRKYSQLRLGCFGVLHQSSPSPDESQSARWASFIKLLAAVCCYIDKVLYSGRHESDEGMSHEQFAKATAFMQDTAHDFPGMYGTRMGSTAGQRLVLLHGLKARRQWDLALEKHWVAMDAIFQS